MNIVNPKVKVALMASMLGTAVAGNAAAADTVIRSSALAVKPTLSSSPTLSASILLKYQQLKQFLIAPMSN